MDIIPGTNSAELLLSMRLPLTEVFRALRSELGLTAEEVAAAVSEVQRRSQIRSARGTLRALPVRTTSSVGMLAADHA